MKRIARQTRRGIALIELLTVLALFAAFTVILSDLFLTIMRAQSDARSRDTFYNRFDPVLANLRRDVWSATSMRVTPSGLELAQPSGPSVLWIDAPDGRLMRAQAGQMPRTWDHFPLFDFEPNGALLAITLHSPAAPAFGGKPATAATEEHVTFVSQAMAAGGAP